MDNNFFDSLKGISGESSLITGSSVSERKAGSKVIMSMNKINKNE